MDTGHPIDATKDVAVDVGVDAPVGVLCCDDGLKKSGCRTCAVGDQCWSKVGTCTQPSTKCGPDNCAGCCLSDTLCADGREVGTCGTNGQACQTCIAPGTTSYGTCVPDATGGTCEGGDTCTPENCSFGCCAGDTCMIGNQDALCGTGGGACRDCTARQGSCVQDACSR